MHNKKNILLLCILLLLSGVLAIVFKDGSQVLDHSVRVSVYTAASGTPAIQNINCHSSRSTNRVAGPAKSQFDAACRLIDSDNHLIWGDQSCGNKTSNREAVRVTVSGTVGGKKIQGVYQPGPCSKAAAAWQRMLALWQDPAIQANSGTPVKLLVLLPKQEFRDPGTWPERERWIAESRKNGMMPPCIKSLPNLDFQLCTLSQLSLKDAQITVRLSENQLYALIKAKPQQVLQIISQAKRTAPPPGYPGYKPSSDR